MKLRIITVSKFFGILSQMNELTKVLPKEVIEFVADSRKKSYELGASPNYDTGLPNEYGFSFEEGGLVYLDVSTEQNKIFAGLESVLDKRTGQKFYSIYYTGGKTPKGEKLGLIVDEAQHGLIIANPTFIRFGYLGFLQMNTEIAGTLFNYREKSRKHSRGIISHEAMSVVDNEKQGQTKNVYKAVSVTTIFANNT